MPDIFRKSVFVLILYSGIQATLAQLFGFPDLVPDLELLQSSIFLQDVPLRNLICAREENCLSSSGYTAEAWQNIIFNGYRRLMKFSVRVINMGNADFLPHLPRERWLWHQCHNHFHSVEVFALYDLLDRGTGARVAEGHKVKVRPRKFTIIFYCEIPEDVDANFS